MGGSKEDAARFLSVVQSDRARGRGHKLQYRQLHVKLRRSLFIVRVIQEGHSLPGELVESPCLELLKSSLDTAC